jgi:hypothetical protein
MNLTEKINILNGLLKESYHPIKTDKVYLEGYADGALDVYNNLKKKLESQENNDKY